MNVKTEQTPGKWILAREPDPRARVRLVCLPYAGAGASVYREWENELPAEVHLCRVQLPGREERLRESPLTRCADIAAALVEHLQPWLDLPVAFFGHSMGALLAFEAQRLMAQTSGILPKHLFLSGRRAPHLPSRTRDLHNLPENELRRELLRFNGTHEKVLRDRELMALIVPILRADFRVCETHAYSPGEPAPVPISVFGGINDPEATRDELDAWSKHTSSTMRLRMFPGDHFFLHSMRAGIISAIMEDLSPYLSHRNRTAAG